MRVRRAPLLSAFILAIMACGALRLAGIAAYPEHLPTPFLAALAAAFPEAAAGAMHSGEHANLLATLDIPASVAMVVLAYLLYVAAASAASPRAAVPPPRLASTLHAAASPAYAWFGACAAAADGMSRGRGARAAAPALVLGAHAAYMVAHLAYMVDPAAHYPSLPAAALAALAPGAVDAATAWENYALYLVLDYPVYLAALAHMTLLAEAALRAWPRRGR